MPTNHIVRLITETPLLVPIFYIGFFSYYWDRIPDKSDLMREGYISAHNLRVWSIMARKAWWQEHEAIGHIEFVVRKQREANITAQFTFSSLFSLGPLLDIPQNVFQ